MQSIQQQLQLLQHIQKVQAPTHLLTKIENRLKTSTTVSNLYTFMFAAAAVCIICINLYVVFFHTKPTTNTIGIELASGMQLNNSNNLYHE
jgi:hypothetical protein